MSPDMPQALASIKQSLIDQIADLKTQLATAIAERDEANAAAQEIARKAAALDKLEVLMRDQDLKLWSTPIDFGVSGYDSHLQGNGRTLAEAIQAAKEGV